MPNLDIRVKGTNRIEGRLKKLRTFIVDVQTEGANMFISDSALRASVDVARRIVSNYPTKGRGAMRWKSEKQRIAVIIKLKQMGNFPYSRSGELRRRWEGKRINPKTVVIENNARDPQTGVFYAPFVIAEWQQPFHKDTGWTKSNESVEKKVIAPILLSINTEIKRVLSNGRI